MNNEEIRYEFFEYVSPYNILVVSNDGEIRKVSCPFKALAKVNFPEIKANDVVMVKKVQIADRNKDVFIIKNNAYHVQHFQVILQ